ATDAGMAMLRSGGNAFDAAVATALTLGVVDGHNSGIGGGCFLLARLADGTFVALDGREMAPAAAARDMFVRAGKADSEASQTGPLASAVPGALALYDEALRRYGKQKLADALLPAAEIAERGFPVDVKYAAKIKASASKLAQFPSSRATLLKADGTSLGEGETLRQPDLARTYRAIATEGIDWFYRGPFAEMVGAWMASHGGIITKADFAAYHIVEREPLVTAYRGHTIVGFPPPSSGGVHVAQILGMLERFDLAALERENPAKRVHVEAEAMKLAFADRAHWLGDPDFAQVPKRLIDPQYIAGLAARIDPARATPVPTHGTPPAYNDELFGKHTTHLTAVDAEGNWVAITATVNTAFGSKVIIPETGVIMNNQMDDFSIRPGVPNSFGLVGAEANAIAPGKRPLSSMSPTMVLKHDRPVMTVGAAGGPTIITQVVLAITNHFDLGDPLDRALARPRFHHQWSPDTLWVEQAMPEAVVNELRSMGHTVERRASGGATQAILIEQDGTLVGVSEPRVPGKASGF
ncbi:MAG TPA: gamma-glutamyltransferase, partial [Pirellulales bacterium]|nr:gamma-glutamyltransferase [Pirellulales bacterium]